ncbi:probable short-chain dehydrogenase [Cephalotrichum gorgonifer]|uniref:Probable short-chain dehydrogenase n=1 Tax=Cephalotrichum gorgonifer TaxID=2041049 RepID=A0AAE8N3M1_9PEZI|nr:probable short-chain dehydrogenase [Cephalotrichum gorgonifer]
MSQSSNTHPTAQDLAAQLASEIKGKVILTTGVSPGGLGDAFVRAIASVHPSLLILAGRNTTKTQATADAIVKAYPEVRVRTLQLDLESLDAVRGAAEEVISWEDVPSIDAVVNNAGIMAVEFALTVDGYERQFATNHLGPFLFTNLIMEKLLATEKPTIVNVSSDGHRLSPVRFADYNFNNGESYNKWTAYGQSKSANMLFALSLAEKLGPKLNLHAFSLHPGVIMTNLGNHLDLETSFTALRDLDKLLGNVEGFQEREFKDLDHGAATTVFAFDPKLKDHNGAYLQDCHVADPWKDTVLPWGTSTVSAARLWKLSEQLVGQEFKY